MRQMSQVAAKGPTIDSIEVAGLELNAGVKEWISKHAPAFFNEKA
jgi:hypothetical protein